MSLHRRMVKFSILLLSAFLLVVTPPLLPPIFHFSPTVVEAQTIQDKKAEADRLLEEGVKEYDDINFGGALGKFEEALLIYQEIDDKLGKGKTLHQIGLIYNSRNEYQQALDYYQRALVIQREVNPAGARITLYRIGKIYDKQGEYQEALNYYQQAAKIPQQQSDGTEESTGCNNHAWQGIILEGIGRVYQRWEDYQESFDYYQQSLAIQQELINCPDKEIPPSYARGATLFYNTGLVAKELRKYQEALDYFQKGLAIYQKLNSDTDEQGAILSQMGIVYRKMGEYSQAIDSFKRAKEISFLIRMFGEGGSLNNLGLVYYDSGNERNALDSYQQALAFARKINDREGEGVSLNNIGVVYDKGGDYQKALDSYQQALVIFQELDNKQELDDKKAVGVILNNIGAAYQKLGKYQPALNSYQQALAIFQKLGKGVRVFTGVTLNNIGATYDSLGKSQQARDYYQQALAIQSEIGEEPSLSKTTLPMTLNLEPSILPKSPTTVKEAQEIRLYQEGVEEFKQGEYTVSLSKLQEALVIAREVGNKQREWTSLNQIGLVYSNMGEYKLALDFFEQALAIPKNVFENTGAIHYNIGLVYSSLGDYDKALEFYQQASALSKKLDNKAGEVSILNTIGNVRSKLGEYKLSLDSYQEALGIIKTMSGEKKILEGATLHNIGKVYLKTEKYQLALDLFQQALTINQQLGDKKSTMVIVNNIGQAYDKLGQNKLALDFLQQGLVIAQEIGAKEGEGYILKNIGYLLEKQKEPELAIVFFKQSVNVREVIRDNIKELDQELQQSYIETVADDYRTLANLLLKQDRVLEAQQVLDLLKIQELDDYLRNVRGNEETEKGINYLPKEQELLTQYNSKLTQIIQLGKELAEIKNISPQKRTPAQEKRRLEIETLQLENQREYLNFINSPEITNIVQQLNQNTGGENLNPQTLIKLQNDLKKMGQDAVILYPLILEERLELVLVTPYSPPIHRTVAVKKEEINRAIAEFRSALTQPNKKISIKPAQTTGKQLYDWLIKPIETALTEANAKTIIYAPDGQLRYIPLAALYDGNQWLVQKYCINNITAVSLTNLDSKPKSMKILAGAFTQGNYNFQIGDSNFSFSGLPFAGKEVENLAKTVPDTTQILDSNFSKSEILAHIKDYSILHFATHAAFVTGQPEESFILFGNGDRANFRDVETWDLTNTDLVVLSACETGLGGNLGDGREILGFGYLMQQGGAKAAMASLWTVDDGGTQVLMNGFYTALTNNNSTKAEALQQAQIALITGDYSGLSEERGLGIVPRNDSSLPSQVENQFSHPYYWASFILIGNGL
ncbi:tetratricopeptide repeat protein [Limnofasciculus baicalensis]|uniref:Tetratricopeptide repeat protein n=1 Tax=Limnofasciculus baicalensis BBK-W-15 TaxID=2699891 RepID=A0AAE3GQ08_9CYAN|nr:tetratricopeptide repeat protein [Limnofasciculus baicalensis]MCP2727793.1 tetratricopeptide repeat protein [Limnofasciculus baicalensis BBK-W-15]